TMAAAMTNETGGNNIVFSNRIVQGVITNIPANTWRGWLNEGQARRAMVLPFGTINGFRFLANSTVLDHAPWVEPETHIFPTATRGSFYTPHWWLNLNTRLLFALVDTSVTPN